MKQIAFLIFLFIASAFRAYASDYNYLIFQQTDGTEQAFGVSGLKLTFENGNMLVQQNGVTSTFPLSQLSKMFFSGVPCSNSTTPFVPSATRNCPT